MPSPYFDCRLIRLLYLFSVTARELNMSRAAETLHMTQPGLSGYIRELEEHLGIPLFERLPRGLKLTSAAQALLPGVEEFISRGTTLERSLAVLGRQHRKILTIGSIHDAMLHWCPKLRRSLAKSRPDICLVIREVNTADIEPLLERHDIDLAVGFASHLENRNLEKFELLREAPVVLLPSDHALCAREAISWADLHNRAWVLIQRETTPQYFDALTALCEKNGVTPLTSYQVATAYEEIAAIACGQGIGVLPEPFKDHLPESVAWRPLEKPEPCWTLSLIWNGNTGNEARNDVIGHVRSTAGLSGLREGF